MPRSLCLSVVLLAGLGASSTLQAEMPTPSVYPVAWKLDLSYGKPARITVQAPADHNPQAYWYLPFTVTNNSDQERLFIPVVELVGSDGKITRSDKNIPSAVLEAVKKQQGSKFLQDSVAASGELRIGPSEAKSVVAIWPETQARMGEFSILIGGISGEYQRVKDAAGTDVLLRRTLQLNFTVSGDEAYPGEDAVNEKPSLWIMH